MGSSSWLLMKALEAFVASAVKDFIVFVKKQIKKPPLRRKRKQGGEPKT